MRTAQLAAGQSPNPLLPNATFFVELIIFLIVLFVFWRFVIPPIKDALSARHDRAQKTIDDNREATKRFREAEQRYQEALRDARAESASIKDEARAEGQRIIDELRGQAQAEIDRIQQQGEQQLAEQRRQLLEELTPEVGRFATVLAGRVIGENVTAGNGHRATVDAFLRDVEGRDDA